MARTNEIQRQATEGIKDISLNRQQASRQTVDRSYARTQPADQQQSLLSALVGAAGATTAAVGTELQKRAEEDKVKQTNRALRGLLPSNDATETGKVAHSFVGLQNKVSAATARAKDEAARFQGSDDEWDEYMVGQMQTIQDELFEQYPDISSNKQKREMLGHITNAFSERLPELTSAREFGKINQEHVARLNSFRDSLTSRTAGLEGEELNQTLAGLMGDNRQALQVTQAEAEEIFTEVAGQNAESGDGRFVEFAKNYKGDNESSLFLRDGKMNKLDRQYKQQRSARQQGDLATAKDGLIEKYMGGDYNWDQLTATADEQNSVHGGRAWTDEQLLALKRKRQGITSKRTNAALAADNMFDARYNDGEPYWVTEGGKPERKVAIQATRARIDEMVKSDIQFSGATDPDQIRAIEQKGDQLYYEILAANQAVDPELTRRFDAFKNYNLDNVTDDNELPKNVTELIEQWDTMPEGTKLDHTNTETAAFMANVDTFRQQGRSITQAVVGAQQASRNPQTMSSEDMAKLSRESLAAAGDIGLGGDWIPFNDAPDWYNNRLGEQIQRGALANMRSGYTDMDRAVADSKAAFSRYYTETDNGQFLFGSRPEIAGQMGVHQDDIDVTLQTYLEKNRTALEDEAPGVTIDEMFFETIPNRGTIVVRNGVTGDRLTAPFPLSQLKTGRDEFIRQQQVTELEWQEQRRTNPGRVTAKGLVFDEPGKDGQPVARTTQGETVLEDRRSFRDAIKQVENDAQLGYDKSSDAWSAIKPFKNEHNIGYGHMLTAEELRTQSIEVDGQTFSFADGESQVTSKVADRLLEQDLNTAEKYLTRNFKGYDDMPDKYKRVLINLQFNAGGVTQKKWPKLTKAMNSGDDAKVRQEMVTVAKLAKGNIRLENRAKTIADSVGLNK